MPAPDPASSPAPGPIPDPVEAAEAPADADTIATDGDTAPTARPRRALPGSRRARWAALAAALALTAGVTTAAVAATGGSPHGGALSVDEGRCGSPAASAAAGPIAYQVTDRAKVYVTVYLTDPSGAEVYAEIPWLTPGRTLPLATTLAAGRYAVRCVFSDGPVRTSRTVTVHGSTTGAVTGYRPLPDLDLTPAVNGYRTWVAAQLPALIADSTKLSDDLARGDLAAARTDWLPAHLDYERLGAAYNSFGDFDDAIDGRADGLPLGTDDPDWSGFHAIEYGLWHGWPTARLRPLAQDLLQQEHGLVKDFPSEDTDPGDLPLRAHEILENTLEFQLTGDADYGSGTSLATAQANVAGTREVVSLLAGLVRPRDPALLTGVDAGLARVDADLAAARRADGAWEPATALPLAQHQRLDADVDQLLEQLSEFPNLLAPRTSA